jgi:hypothetical protein
VENHEATLQLISGPAEDEEAVTMREMRAAMGALDDHLSRIEEFMTQLQARGVRCDWFDALADWHASTDFQESWDYFYRYRDDSDDSAAEQYEADCEADDEDEATND